MLSVEFLYCAAANAGMLQKAVFDSTEVMVDFRAPDEDVLSGLGVSRDYAIRYPLTWLPSLAAGNTLEISGQTYRVREITAIAPWRRHRLSVEARIDGVLRLVTASTFPSLRPRVVNGNGETAFDCDVSDTTGTGEIKIQNTVLFEGGETRMVSGTLGG